MKTTCLPESRSSEQVQDLQTISGVDTRDRLVQQENACSVARQHARVKSFCCPYDNSPAVHLAAFESDERINRIAWLRHSFALPRPQRRTRTAREQLFPFRFGRARTTFSRTGTGEISRRSWNVAAMPSRAMRWAASRGQLALPQEDRPDSGLRNPVITLSECGFPCAVRTDNGDDARGREFQVQVRQSADSVKRFAETFALQRIVMAVPSTAELFAPPTHAAEHHHDHQQAPVNDLAQIRGDGAG